MTKIAGKSGTGYNGGKAITEGAGDSLKPQALMDELAKSGIKYNSDDVVMVMKTFEGKLLWLENGSSSSGLYHITKRHAAQFADRGISDIPSFLNRALQKTPVKTGFSPQGPFAEYMVDGKMYKVIYGSNGYTVTFFPIK